MHITTEPELNPTESLLHPADADRAATKASPRIVPLPTPEPMDDEGELDVMTLIDRLDGAEARIDELERERRKLAALLRTLDDNPLLLALRHLDRGAVLADAGEATERLFALCQQTQGRGRVTVTLAVAPSIGHPRALLYTAEVKLTEPREEAPAGFLFLTPEGHLTRQNHEEPELDLDEPPSEPSDETDGPEAIFI
jgi:hypothetical protein